MANNAAGGPQTGPRQTFTFAADTNPYQRVYINGSGQAAIAGATNKSIGILDGNGVDVSEDPRGEVLHHINTSITIMRANAAISAGAFVYAAADGEVAPAGSVLEGIALDAAGADQDLIRVAPIAGPTQGLVLGGSVTVSSAQAAANSGDGQVDIVTGTGVAPTSYVVQVLTVTTGVVKAGYIVSLPAAGTIRLTGVDTTAEMNEGDIITWIAMW